MAEPVLKIENLNVRVRDGAAVRDLVRGLSFEVPQNSIVALVGGSGSGKTTTGLSILRLLPPALTMHMGRIYFKGKNLVGYSEEQMRAVRGRQIGMVFQEPLTAFNPLFTIGAQIEEVLITHTNLDREARAKKIEQLLVMVGASEPRRMAASYPFQLSGGMRQRAMIAQAIAGDPALIIADEPTSSLDVTLQARIIELFKKLRSELKLSILLITHDLGMVGHLADQVIVLSEGRAVEAGPTAQVLKQPSHPYTLRLMNALAV